MKIKDKHFICNLEEIHKMKKKHRNPRKKVMEDYRHHRGTAHWYCHEKKRARKKMKRKLYDEAYYHPIPHDYKTYGWESW